MGPRKIEKYNGPYFVALNNINFNLGSTRIRSLVKEHSMYSKSQFHALEVMCRERAVVAAKEMEYWLSEAEEWRKLRHSPNPFPERTPIQLDWCLELNNR